MTSSHQTRYIFITGGVVSSLGKGIAASAIASILMERGLKLRIRKLDPYLNVDPGTMSPYQHGECYVTDDGAETDLDLGHYERFTGVHASKNDNITTGQIYQNVINKERHGDYEGKTVQVIPHVTDAIKEFITSNLNSEDIVICEIGGTVGDIEGLPFLEAIRQLANDVGRANTCFIHVTLLPYINTSNELKTKPTQHSVKELLSVGIQPDIILCRSSHDIAENECEKIARFCNVNKNRVLPALDVDSIYKVPINYYERGIDAEILRYFAIDAQDYPLDNLKKWDMISTLLDKSEGEVDIAIIGKYTSLPDAYKSLNEALIHGGLSNHVKVNIHWISAEEFDDMDDINDCAKKLKNIHAIIVPGGFGERGTQGMINVISYARQRHIPFLGICFGMQMAVIEFARNVLALKDVGSSEFGDYAHNIIGLLTEWQKGNVTEYRNNNSDLGGTMRLGAYPCHLLERSNAHKIYNNAEVIYERHRHRYEVNIDYRGQLEDHGLLFSGLSPDGVLPEIIEICDHDWFIGVQFHPELISTPFVPHPLFTSLIGAALRQSRLL